MKLVPSGSRAINVDARYPFVGTSASTQDDGDSKTIKRIISSYGFLLACVPFGRSPSPTPAAFDQLSPRRRGIRRPLLPQHQQSLNRGRNISEQAACQLLS
jgi:hypothetical protein